MSQSQTEPASESAGNSSLKWDETDGWIFSESAHRWMNWNRKTGFRSGDNAGVYNFRYNHCEIYDCIHKPERPFTSMDSFEFKFDGDMEFDMVGLVIK